MALDPTKHADWEIAEEAESRMKTVYELGEKLGLAKEELLPHGHSTRACRPCASSTGSA